MFREQSMSRTQTSEWKRKNSQRLKKERHVKSEDKSKLVIFYIKGIVLKEFILAEQTANYAYCGILW
jgi:hypothetical protein